MKWKEILRRGFVLIAVLALLAVCCMASAHSRDRAADPLSINIDSPYDRVVNVVREVAGDGIIQGTSQYFNEIEINGAQQRDKCGFFGNNVPAGAEVFYKVREEALAPTHFIDSSDAGTVAVRYIVQKLPDKNKAQITIQALFVPNSHHGKHPSDGNVETSELLAVALKLKAIEEREKNAAQIAARTAAEQKIKDLHHQIKAEQEQLDDVTAQVSELEKRAQAAHLATHARVTGQTAPLKAAPYTEAPTLAHLDSGASVTVLSRSKYWSHVRLADGTQGWVYHLFLEAAQ